MITRKLSLNSIKQESNFRLIDEKYRYYSIAVDDPMFSNDDKNELEERKQIINVSDLFLDELLTLILSYININNNNTSNWLSDFYNGDKLEELLRNSKDKHINYLLGEYKTNNFNLKDVICGKDIYYDPFFSWILDYLFSLGKKYNNSKITFSDEVKLFWIYNYRVENNSVRKYEVTLPSLEKLFNTPEEAIKYINDLYEKEYKGSGSV